MEEEEEEEASLAEGSIASGHTYTREKAKLGAGFELVCHFRSSFLAFPHSLLAFPGNYLESES
jgi:hypothetical protein